MKLRFLIAALCALGWVAPAQAQSPPAGMTPCSAASISVTNSSGNQLLSTCAPTVVLWNLGAAEVFYNLGTTSAVTATTSNYSLPAGSAITLNVASTTTYLAAITASSTATLRIVQGWGFPALALSGIGAGGTANQGTAAADAGSWPVHLVQGTTANSSSNPIFAQITAGTDPCQSPAIAKSSAAISVTSATTTSLVAVSGSTAVYACGFSMTIAPSATSADTAQFEYGTGASCTGTHALTGTFGNGDLTTAAPPAVISYSTGGTIFSAPASNGICIVTAGTTVNVQGVLTYVQQ